MSASNQTTTTLVERVQSFVAEHKRAVLIGSAAAALGVAGAAYYASTSRRAPPPRDTEQGPAVEEKKKKKKTGSKGAKKKAKKDDGPLLEEVKPAPPAELDLALDTAAIRARPEEERMRYAAAFKTQGNAAYSRRAFADAAESYTKAIEVSPKPEPVFYSNRAACYVNFQPPEHEKVVADCDSALKLDPNYVKALNRRAVGLEGLGRYEEALRDFTAATILDKFQNPTTSQAVERVLKTISATESAKILAQREPRLPSHTFVAAYFAAFRPRPALELPEQPSQGDETLHMALQALDAGDYVHALSLVNEAIDQEISFDAGKAEAYNLRGTFKFLIGDIDGSKADLQTAIGILPASTQSLVKIASVHMEQGDPVKAFDCFEEAIKQNAADPDIYYHRGQVLFIMSDFDKAAEDYTKSTELDDQFVFSHIQLAVAQYKAGNIANSMAQFRRTMKAFPGRSEPQNYYGELLLDQQRFEDAVEKFERAIEIEKAKARPNVLPLVNKGLALYQWKQDIGAAEACCDEALRIDPDCDAAVATLAQLSLQQSKIQRAMEMFKKQVDLARTEPELQNALTYQYATAAQLEFLNTYPEMAAQLNAMARGV